MTNKITVVIKRPGEEPKVERILDDYKVLQDLVGGLFDIVHLDSDLIAVVHDESAIDGMQLSATYGEYFLFGTVIFLGRCGPECVDVPNWFLQMLGTEYYVEAMRLKSEDDNAADVVLPDLDMTFGADELVRRYPDELIGNG